MKSIWGALGFALTATAASAAATPPAPAAAAPTAVAPAAPVAGNAAAAHKPLGGLNYDSSKPIQVNADTFFADMNAETGTYTGNVIVVQGDMKMRADVVKVIAPDGKARRMEAHGHVVVDSPSGTATGDDGIYDVLARIIHLTGSVKLVKNQNVMRGTALDVAMETGEAHLVATDQQGKPARVQAVFVPQNQAAPNKPPKPHPQGTAPATPAASPQPAAAAPAPATTPQVGATP